MPWLTYPELAQALGMSRTTLVRRLDAYNRKARKEGAPELRPDQREPQNEGAPRHLFNSERLPAIEAALKNLTVARRGRPKEGETPS